MTDNEASILTALEAVMHTPAPWLTPRQFGGKRCSHHAITAKRMVGKGWVGREAVPTTDAAARPPTRFWITDHGANALANHNAMKGFR